MNHTQQKRLVSEERKGFGPKPGHDVVVFELVENGLRFDRILREGEVFEPKRKHVFGKPPEYASWAVNKHPNLRHSFTQRFDHMSGGHSFDLTFTLLFAADDPRLLVSNLINDPLKMVQDQVSEAVGAAVAATPWNQLFNSKLEENFTSFARKEILPLYRGPMEADALHHGIRLNEVEIALSLTNEDVAVLAEATKREREKKMAALDLDRNLDSLKQTTEVEDHKLSSQLLLIDKQQELVRRQKTLDREQKMQDSLVDAAGIALRNMGEDTRSPESFMRASEAVARTFHATASKSGGQSHTGISGSATQAFIEGAHDDPFVSLVRETLDLLGPLRAHGVAGRELIANALHWIAELYRGSNSEVEALECYKERVMAGAAELNNDLSGEQYTCVRKLLDSDSVRAKLAELKHL